MKAIHKKPVLHLTNDDRDDRSVMIDIALSLAVENNMDWEIVFNRIKDKHEHCILLLELCRFGLCIIVKFF